jgi:hypothetical protein
MEILKLAFNLGLNKVILHVREQNTRAMNCTRVAALSLQSYSQRDSFQMGHIKIHLR